MVRWILGGAVGGLLFFAIFAIFILPLIGANKAQPFYRAPYFHDYEVMRVSDDPLFTAAGGINENVLDALLAILHTPSLSPALRPVTAADFSSYVVPEPLTMSHSGAIIIQLFESVPEANGLAGAWWQLVYRTTDEGNDVLTLWMTEPYRLSQFNGSRYDKQSGREDERFTVITGNGLQWAYMSDNGTNESDNGSFFLENNYGTSIAREELFYDISRLLEIFDASLFLVAPRDIPGQWQSAYAQTGENAYGRYYVTGQFQTPNENENGSANPNDGLGAAGLIWGHHAHFSLNNGKDGKSAGPFENAWPHTTVISTCHDLIWLPSDFETRSMGHNNESARFQTFIADPGDTYSALRWNYIVRDEDPRRHSTDWRSGLWQLNGFDRAFYARSGDFSSRAVWLRSADSLAIGNINTIYHTGNRYSLGVNQSAGLRPAVHISVTRLEREN